MICQKLELAMYFKRVHLKSYSNISGEKFDYTSKYRELISYI